MNEISRIDPESARPERQRKPDWIRVKAPTSAGFAETRRLMRSKNLATVCEEAACPNRSEEHTSELQSLMRISYAVFCLKKKNENGDDKEKKGTKQNNKKTSADR